jgi:hypothetical protein
VLFVSPPIVHESAPLAHAQVLPPGEAVTVYLEMPEPPSDAGAAQLTVAEPSAAVAVTVVGAPGTLSFTYAMTFPADLFCQAGIVPAITRLETPGLEAAGLTPLELAGGTTRRSASEKTMLFTYETR